MVANHILGRVCHLQQQVFRSRRTILPVGLKCITSSSIQDTRNSSSTTIRRYSSDTGNEDDNRRPSSNKDKKSKSKAVAGPNKSAADGDEGREERKLTAKSKLNDLLRSIVKEQEARETEKADKPKVDFNLARSVKEKPAPLTEEEKAAKMNEKETEKEIGKQMLSAVKSVATTLDGDPKQVETELVQKLMSHLPTKVDLKEIFSGMKVDSSKEQTSQTGGKESQDLSRAHQVRRTLESQQGGYRSRADQESFRSRGGFQRDQERRPTDGFTYKPIDLFGSHPLGIFKNVAKQMSESQESSESRLPQLKTWDALYKKELKSFVTHPPANGFEEMMLWTDQGKLWKFPIDNEQGLDIEAKVPFHEHVFLEPHIESWCPKRGPLRHFMELVCVGLGKNPYLTVEEKKGHIEWYHQYFKNKTSVIKEIGGMEAVKQ